MVKRCCYGTCNSDTRYPERLEGGVKFIPFPKPITSLEKCMTWIRLCGRPHTQLNVCILKNRNQAKHLYVCTKHFKDGKPTKKNPNPEPALPYDKAVPARRVPKATHARPTTDSEPVKKKLKEEMTSDDDVSSSKTDDQSVLCTEIKDEPIEHHHSEESLSAHSATGERNTPLDVLALACENSLLRQKVAQLMAENEQLSRKQRTEATSTYILTCTIKKEELP